jgi:hypothetical protein
MSCIKKGRSCISGFKFPKSTTTFYENYKKSLTEKSYKTQCEKKKSKFNSNIDKNQHNQTNQPCFYCQKLNHHVKDCQFYVVNQVKGIFKTQVL